MATRITDDLVKGLPLPASGNRVTYDDKVRGFGIRVTAGGAKAFVLNYRIAGRERRMAIGRYPDWSVESARKRAKELRQDVDRGIDPLGTKQADRAAPTVADLCERYIEEHLPDKRASSARDDRAMIDNIIRPKLGAEKVAAVDQTRVRKLHRSLATTPYRANRVLALLSKMFTLSIGWGMRGDHPVKGVKRFDEIKRTEYLSPEQISRLVSVLDTYADQGAANIVRLLLLTGARSGEVRFARWAHFDLDRKIFNNDTKKEEPAPIWTKPPDDTKQNKAHRVPLSDGAFALLKSMYAAAPRDDDGKLKNDYLFPGPLSGKPRTEIKDEWREIASAAGLYDVVAGKNAKGEPVETKVVKYRLHDLRHTYASLLVSSGLSLPIIGALLGHTQPGTTARYAHLMDDPLRQATNRVSDIVSGRKAADVVPIGERVA